MTTCDVTIIGAGPYGLSAAAHLRTVKGLEFRVFGIPMAFWNRNMPRGMFLRSAWTATHIADPAGRLTLEAFQEATHRQFSTPVPLDQFVQYGLWYQRQAVPEVDRRAVLRIEPAPGGFRVCLEDGEQFVARRMIVAAGIGAFAYRPPEFYGLPPCLATHSSEHHDFQSFGGKDVLVVGGGQSALESAALLHEARAQVEIVTRAPRIHWLQGWLSTTLHYRLGKFTKQLIYAPTDVGPAVISQLLARPELIRRLPRILQDKLRKRATRPAGARWLVDRLKDVPIKLHCAVVSVDVVGERARVQLSDGSERTVDHVLLGTGYKIDISKYGFLSPEFTRSIRRNNGYPLLKEGLESAVPALHFLGAPAAWSFGPLMQFVSGARYASRVLLRSITGRKSSGSEG
jgi:FAD-dependent urate hydroxylase